MAYFLVLLSLCFLFFFVFKQKTAYEMRISDGSSDVCSSDLETWQRAIAALEPGPLVIGGKSMGGRMASLIADEAREGGASVVGLACLGYPFHPTGKPERLRTDHLATLRTPCLICQGTRDPLGNAEELAGYELAASIRRHWAADGDHHLAPRKASGRTAEQNWTEAVEALDSFFGSLTMIRSTSKG